MILHNCRYAMVFRRWKNRGKGRPGVIGLRYYPPEGGGVKGNQNIGQGHTGKGRIRRAREEMDNRQ